MPLLGLIVAGINLTGGHMDGFPLFGTKRWRDILLRCPQGLGGFVEVDDF